MSIGEGAQQRGKNVTSLNGEWAVFGETATERQVDWRWRVALQLKVSAPFAVKLLSIIQFATAAFDQRFAGHHYSFQN